MTTGITNPLVRTARPAGDGHGGPSLMSPAAVLVRFSSYNGPTANEKSRAITGAA